jgi:hypothetical protein
MELHRRFIYRANLYLAIGLAAALSFVLAVEHSDAHKLVTSKYGYNKDIFPLLRDRCGSCHVAGGPAPMSLVTYADAVPWAESIRDELTAGRMPPWPVDPTSPAVKGSSPISAREIDMIVVWASGGTPQGDDAQLPAVTYNPHWKLGPPDLKIPMDAEHTMEPGSTDERVEFSIQTNLADTKWVKAADLMPGTASIVRDAVINIENGPVLALWEPGDGVVPAPSGAAFRLAPGSKIHLQIHYKKHYDQEQNAVSDRSTIGLYFTDPPPSGREMQSFSIDSPEAPAGPEGALVFKRVLGANARIVALRPMLDRAYQSLSVDAITPSGTDVPILRLQGPRPQWIRRYWLQEPVELASGTQITVHVTPLSDYSDEPRLTKKLHLQVALDYVPL